MSKLPLWYCIEYGWHIMYECDVAEVHAHDAEEAARTFVENHDATSGDYPCIQGSCPQVLVVSQTEFHLFRVTGEIVYQYSARPMEEADDE